MPQITLDLSAAHATRLQDALTEALELDAPATIDDAKDYIIADLKQFVRTSEQRVAGRAAREAVAADVDIT